jgi:hypothetical protein
VFWGALREGKTNNNNQKTKTKQKKNMSQPSCITNICSQARSTNASPDMLPIHSPEEAMRFDLFWSSSTNSVFCVTAKPAQVHTKQN